MRKITALLTALLVLLACAGCAVVEKVDSIRPQATLTADADTDKAAKPTAKATDTPAADPTPAATAAPTPVITPEPIPEPTPEPTPEPVLSWQEVEVRFEVLNDENYREYALLIAVDTAGNEIWRVQTDPLEIAQLSRVNDVGRWQDRYYFVNDGILTALSVTTGEVLWTNEEFGGSAVASVIDEIGTVYLSGYFGPDFFMADKDGETLHRIATIHKDFYWPYHLQLSDGCAYVRMEGGPEGSDPEGFIFVIDLTSFYVSGPVR